MSRFRSAWWLPGAHAPTLWGKFGRREPLPALRWEHLDTPDGDFVELAHADIAPDRPYTPPAVEAGASNALQPAGEAASDTSSERLRYAERPRLLILHGLEGGAHSHCVRGLMREAQSRGWNATLMLFRTCGPTPNRQVRSYHSGETTDALLVIEGLVHRAPAAPLGVAGISLGGNVLCKLLGERGDNLPAQLKAAASVSAPFDLARASRYIGRGFGRVYERAFLRSLVPKAAGKIGRHPELAALGAMPPVRTIWQFDDQFTSPVHGFANAADYYARSSSLQFLPGIMRPTLLLNAVNDPFLPPAVLEDVKAATRSNSAITTEFPEQGGHVGFVAGRSPWRPFYYGEWRVAEFLAQHMTRASAPVMPAAAGIGQ